MDLRILVVISAVFIVYMILLIMFARHKRIDLDSKRKEAGAAQSQSFQQGFGRDGRSSPEPSKGIGKTCEPSQEHRNLLRKPYRLQCRSEVFTKQELEALNKYGSWISALVSGQIAPETDEQLRFVEYCRSYRSMNLHDMNARLQAKEVTNGVQVVWLRYLFRIKFEQENKGLPAVDSTIAWRSHATNESLRNTNIF